MTGVDNKRALPMPQLGVMILPFRDAVAGFAVGRGFPIENLLMLAGNQFQNPLQCLAHVSPSLLD